MDVKSLIADLSAHGVESFEGYGIKVSFYQRGQSLLRIPYEGELTGVPKENLVDKPELNDKAMAQNMEGELSYDKVLNWSGSPDPTDLPTPLTGDELPLTNNQG